MDTETLLDLMHDYLNQYGEMDSFLEFCEEQEGHNREDVKHTIEQHFYGG